MAGRITRRNRRVGGPIVGVLSMLLNLVGCASEPSKPAATVAPDQVRSHADKAFEKLKEEERERAPDPAMAP